MDDPEPDPDARLAFALTFYGYLFRHALHLTQHWQDAEDVTQTTLIKVWQAAPFCDARVDTERGMKALLLRVSNNTWYDELRKRQRRPRQDSLSEFETIRRDETLTVEVVDCLSAIPPRYAALLIDLYVLGRTMDEIGAHDGITRGGVKGLSARAKSSFRQAWAA